MKPLLLSLALIGAASPGQSWTFSIEDGLCVLSHGEGVETVRLTFDAFEPLYAITLTRDAPWPNAPNFCIRFEGARPLTIQTDRHMLSADGLSLTVTDSGFGNVLDGLEFNARAVGIAGGAELAVSLDGAAPAVRAFRACEGSPTA